MIRASFHWLGHTELGLYMRNSTWGFAGVEAVHLLGLATLGGAALVIGLTAGGIMFRRNDPAAVIRAAVPILIVGLVVMIGSGVLLVASKPIRYYLDPTFRAKMALILVASAASALTFRLSTRPDGRTRSLGSAGLSTLALWVGVGVCGRIIGFL